MSVPNKSLDKNKRYAGVKANEFVNKTRANEVNRSGVRPQGWANLGKINSRRVPPPANVPSLKSETGVNAPTFDPTATPNHGWTSNDNSATSNSPSNPTQQQLDSMPVSSPTPPSSADIDKTRIPPTWSTITAGANASPNEATAPSLLALNDFPRLATTQDRKSQSESMTNAPNPTFRPANLATWKEGGGTRVPPLSNDIPQMMPTHPGANFYPQANMRMCPPEMWNYNPYTPVPLPIHHHHHHQHHHQQQQHQRRVNSSLNDYKSPTILRNKDIEDLSKITDNTWANASQEVNYEEKIRFSDDEDTLDNNSHHHHHQQQRQRQQPSRMTTNPTSKHVRLIHDDEHLKQMQDNKNSELINALTIAKQRRDEQERHLRNEKLGSHSDEQKSLPGYQTRPLLASNDQENYSSSSSPVWQSNKDTPRTPNSQSSFAMKSWSDQMESLNCSSLHETGHAENEDPSIVNQYSGSQSESNSQSQILSKKSKRPILLSKKPVKSNYNSTKRSLQVDQQQDHYENSADQWENWNESNENQSRQQFSSDDHSTSKITRSNKSSSIKTRPQDRMPVNTRSKPTKIHSSIENKPTNNKPSSATHIQSTPPPPQLMKSLEPIVQESMTYKSQQRTNASDHKQRYQTNTINTASIPPLMSVRSDATTTAKLFQNMSSDYYEDDNGYYDSSNLQTHSRYHQSNLHNRGYTTLGSYGRYRRGGTIRQQQQHQYPNYHLNNTSRISSAPTTTTSTGTHPKKNSNNNKKSNTSSEQMKTIEVDDIHSPVVKTPPAIEETKPSETLVLSPMIELEKSNGTSEPQPAIKPDTPLTPSENDSTKPSEKTSPSVNPKQRTNKNSHDQRYQNQQAPPPRHRNNYSQNYDSMQGTNAQNYYGTNRRTTNSNRMHDLSSGYYYEPSSTHYNNRYNYSTGHYPSNHQQRSHPKNSKRGVGSSINHPHHRQQKHVTINGNNNNNNTNPNFRHHSTSDNDQKEGEEWETASESSTNMRNGHDDNNNNNNHHTTSKIFHRGRTPPKKSFSSQRPHARQFFKYTNA